MRWLLALACLLAAVDAKSATDDDQHVVMVDGYKALKALFKSKTNVLVYFYQEKNADIEKALTESAKISYGQGTIAFVNCAEGEAKKLCKKMKVDGGYALKHFNRGQYTQDYERKITAKSVSGFLYDPNAEIPWEDDASSAHVVHITSPADFSALLAKKKPTLVMFYAPWCGHCKKLKPAYGQIASSLKSSHILAAVDLTQKDVMPLGKLYKIQGYPTLEFFDGGKHKFRYEGARDKDTMTKWLKNPTEKAAEKEKPKEPEQAWSEQKDTQVAHLTDATFDAFMSKNEKVLVMIYAPWCGHCKRMKPEYEKAAAAAAKQGIKCRVAAVDATQNKDIATRLSVRGYPTLKYFEKGEDQFEANVRSEKAIVEFLNNPTAPPPPEKPWSEQESAVLHLTSATFKDELKTKKHAIVMFYAPWCGHCKKAKPQYTEAAEKIKKEKSIAIAAVDCTKETDVCSKYKVEGYPTFKYFSNGELAGDYDKGRTAHDFAKFLDKKKIKDEL